MVMLERHDAVNRAIDRFLTGGGAKSWRGRAAVGSGGGQPSLLARRPWLAHYEAGVPHTIGIPRIPVQHLLRSAVRRFPLRTALLFEGARLSFRRLNRESNRFANALLSLGVARGARVMIYLPNTPQAVVAFFGTLKAGCVTVFSPPMSTAAELARQAREVQASVFVTLNLWTAMLPQVQREGAIPFVLVTDVGDYLPWIKRVALALKRGRTSSSDYTSFRRWLSGQPRQSPTVDVEPDELAVIQYRQDNRKSKGVIFPIEI
jgi:long-chain acyl-CoA synthetase